MRNMSFSATTRQVQARRKHVTRRLGWRNLKRGDHLMGVEKAQGLKKGEHVTALCVIEVIETKWEPLDWIVGFPIRTIPPDIEMRYPTFSPSEMTLEGFPELLPREYVAMFMQMNRGSTPKTPVNRILFDYIEVEP